MPDFLIIFNHDIMDAMAKSVWYSIFVRVLCLIILLKIIDIVFKNIQKNILARTQEIEAIKQIKTILRFMHMVANTIAALFVIIAFLGSIGLNIKPLLATAGVAGIAVGYASKRFIEDIIAGIIIITSGQIRMGDYVNIAGKEGTVENIDLKSIVL